MLSFKKCLLKFLHYFRSCFRPSVQARARRARSLPPSSPSITSPWSCPLSAPRWAWSPGAGARSRSRTCSTGWWSAWRQVRRNPTAAGKWDKENERNVGMKYAYKYTEHNRKHNLDSRPGKSERGTCTNKEPCNYEHFGRDTKLWTPPCSKLANFFPYLRFPLADLPDATDPFKQARFSNLFMGKRLLLLLTLPHFWIQFASASIWRRTKGGGGGGEAISTVVLCGLTGEKQCGENAHKLKSESMKKVWGK